MRGTGMRIAIAAMVALAVVILTVVLVRRYRRKKEIFIKFQTMQGPVLVYTIRDDDGRLVRVMESQGAYESAAYLDDDLRYELVFGYHRAYNHVFDPGVPVESMLVIGGGGFAYPEYVVSHYPDIHVDVVEIDPMVISIAHRYFFLDRLIAEYDVEATGQLEVICEDGREYLDAGKRRYDAIINDCFQGRSPVMSLASVEAARSIKDCLNPGGVYMSNVISSLEGEDATFISSIVKTLSEVFEHVYVIAGLPDSPGERDNNVVVATDGDQLYGGTVEFHPLEDAPVFHDGLQEMYQELFRVEDK